MSSLRIYLPKQDIKINFLLINTLVFILNARHVQKKYNRFVIIWQWKWNMMNWTQNKTCRKKIIKVVYNRKLRQDIFYDTNPSSCFIHFTYNLRKEIIYFYTLWVTCVLSWLWASCELIFTLNPWALFLNLITKLQLTIFCRTFVIHVYVNKR